MVLMGIVWTLRALVILAFPAAFVVVLLHPSLGLDATGTGVPLVMGSTFVLMKKVGPLHQCPGRHTTRAALRTAVDANTRKLECYEKWFGAIGINPSDGPRKRDLKLIQGRGGDSSPGRRVGLGGLARHLGGVAALGRDVEPALGEPDHAPANVLGQPVDRPDGR